MENCFRFLINVDQCLNMSHFDIFFYKLESRHKFHLNQVQLFGDAFGTSLRNAVMDIRMYLDKYPYHVGDCQIIVAMRSRFQKNVEHWEETMLYRLLQLNMELRNARIYINSRERMEKALNLIMLYDADFSAELPNLGNYISSKRFQDDCQLLLKHLGVTESVCSENAAAWIRAEGQDPAAAEVMERFLESRRCHDDLLEEVGTEQEGNSLLNEFMPFLKDQLANFQVFEAQIDRNNRRQNILALLKVVDFINMSVEQQAGIDGSKNQMSLAQRCERNWNQVWNDSALELRYADMLRRYQQRLNIAANELENPGMIAPASAQILPKENVPGDQAIVSNEGAFAANDPDKQGSDLRKILGIFLNNSFSVKTVKNQWKAVYQRIKKTLDQMDHELKSYAEDLSRQYATALEQRKRESAVWKANFFTAQKDTPKDISRLEYERDQRLQQLKNPHMNPTLSFQDQLNMENSLEQGNLNIEFLLRCLSAVTALNFLCLVGICALLCFLHYTVLQPYVFQGLNSMVYYLIYLAATLVFMLFSWGLPYQHFRKKLKKCIVSLQQDMEKYISGYFEKAEQFCTYINLLNQLDYINRYHRLLCQAHDATHKLSQGYLWHKVQVRNHLAKLQFFQGLIELSDVTLDGSSGNEQSLPNISGTSVSDVVDSPIYWPQN